MGKDISIMIDKVKFNYRVGVILEYKGKIMLENGARAGHKVLPGGRVKTREDTKTALIREISEEMHYDISKKDIKLQAVIENFFTIRKTNYHELYFVYRVRLDDTDEIVHRRVEDLINYDAKSNWYEFVDLKNIENENIKPVILKKIIQSKYINGYIVRD